MSDAIQTRHAIQTRSLDNQELHLDGDYLTGYCVVYGETTQGLVSDRTDGRGNRFLEQIDPNAFSETLNSINVRFIAEHDNDIEHGDTDSKNLILIPDDKGIQFRMLIPQHAKRFKEKVQQGIFKGMSFGFVEEQSEIVNGVKHIKKGKLDHISPTYAPAYRSATFEMRKLPNKLARAKRKLMIEKSR